MLSKGIRKRASERQEEGRERQLRKRVGGTGKKRRKLR